MHAIYFFIDNVVVFVKECLVFTLIIVEKRKERTDNK